MIIQTFCLGLCFAFQNSSGQAAPMKSLELPSGKTAPIAAPFWFESVPPILHVVLARSVAAPIAPPVSAPDLSSPVAATFMRTLTPAIPHLAPTLTNAVPTVVKAASVRNPEDTLVTLDSVDIQLMQVLHLLAEQTGINLLLISKDDAARLTICIKNRRFIDALRDICAMKDLSYLKVDNTYVIGPDEKLKTSYVEAYDKAHGVAHEAPKLPKQEEEIISETYKTNCIDATKLVEPLQTAFKEAGLIVVPAPAQIVPNIVSQQNQSTGNGTTVQPLDKDVEALKISRQIYLRGPRSVVLLALEMMRALDVAPAQVNIAVSITDVSNDALRDLGVEWDFGTTTTTLIPSKGISFGAIERTPLTVTSTLKMLETAGKAKVLATPHLSVLDGQRGYILVGQRVTYPVAIGTNQNGGIIFSTQQEKVGIYMQVAVWITNAGRIRMNLFPQVSTITGFLSVQGAQYPQISTREAQATLDVESGKTIVMGGLLNDEDTSDSRAVPLLSQIPLFGELFKSRHHTHSRNQVIITITPTLIPSGG